MSLAIADCSVCTDGCLPPGRAAVLRGEVYAVRQEGRGGRHVPDRPIRFESPLRPRQRPALHYHWPTPIWPDIHMHGSGWCSRQRDTQLEQAMVAALQPKINDPDDEYACNGGFLRDDALLVVTLIEDGDHVRLTRHRRRLD